MNRRPACFCLHALTLCFALTAFADGSGDAFSQARLAHERAVNAVLDPLNRDYKAALERMAAAARQANNLDLIARVQQQLDKLSIKTPSLAELGPMADFVGKWDYLYYDDGQSDVLDFLPDGTWTAAKKERFSNGTWVFADNHVVVNFDGHDWHDYYDLPLQDGVLLGHNSGDQHMQLKRHGVPLSDEVKTEIVGLWNFHTPDGRVVDVSLASDGEYKMGGNHQGTWQIANKRLYLRYDGHSDWHDIYDLPMTDNVLHGHNTSNDEVTLTRVEAM